MSDTMLFGVLRMPYELAMSTELSRRQFHDRAQQACDALEAMQADGAKALEHMRSMEAEIEAMQLELAASQHAYDDAHQKCMEWKASAKAMQAAHIKEIESLRMLLSDALSALEYHQDQTRPIHSTKVAIDMIRRGIA